MMSSNVIRAIDAALTMLKLNKLCFAAEDNEAYYFTGCGDNGERICGEAACRVDKKTFASEPCYHTSSYWNTQKKKVEIPKERKSVFIEETE